jgi:hypothetical protein
MLTTIAEGPRTHRRAPCRPGRRARAGFAVTIFLVAGGLRHAPTRAACEGAAPAAVTVNARGGEVRAEG